MYPGGGKGGGLRVPGLSRVGLGSLFAVLVLAKRLQLLVCVGREERVLAPDQPQRDSVCTLPSCQRVVASGID